MALVVALLVALLLLVQSSPCVLASQAKQSIVKSCGVDKVAILESDDGYYHLAINGDKIQDVSCEKLRSYLRSGCFCDDTQLEVLRGVYRQYCGQAGDQQDLNLLVHEKNNANSDPKVARKLLRELSVDASANNKPSIEIHLPENIEELPASSETDELPLAIPGMVLLCCGFLVPCFRPRKKEVSRHNFAANQMNSVDSLSSMEVSTSSEKIPATPHRVPPSPSRFAMASPQIRVGSVNLSIQQIIKATQNFSPALKLGEGGFGTVYKAMLQDGQIVAVKRAKKDQFPGPRDEFSNEVDLLAKIDHRNLVRLLGFTDKGNERIIITEYVPNGTLREHLDGQPGILDFNQRLEIAIDVAHALTYLHLYAEKTIIHRDVKSSNILLTDSYRAKVSDFGFARSGPSDTEKTHISTKVKGTAGYLDPEYLRTYQLTPKSDVFSFGILLVEILSARRPVELKRTPEERITIRWAFKKFNEGNMREILDPLLEDPVDDEVLEKLLSLVFHCAAPTREDRPSMKEVGEQLWEIRKEYGISLKKP